jgi:Leucine-rich repeat (LRR) protein
MKNITCINLVVITIFACTMSSLFAAEKSQELSIADLIKRGELPAVDAKGILDLARKGLTSLHGLSMIKDKARILDLNLGENKIQSIHERDFEGFGNMTGLTLYHNEIKTISVHAFKHLKNLEVLFLSRNQLKTVHKDMLKGLNNLTGLFLQDNQIQTIPMGFLQNASNLKDLSVSHNAISTIDPRIFQGLNHLLGVNLGWNNFTEKELEYLREELRQRYPNSMFSF